MAETVETVELQNALNETDSPILEPRFHNTVCVRKNFNWRSEIHMNQERREQIDYGDLMESNGSNGKSYVIRF